MNTSGPLRFYQVKADKKPLLRWLWNFRLMLPHRVWDSEAERYEWRRHVINPRWNYEAGPMLQPGDAGYDDAPYEVAFLCGPQAASRFVAGDEAEH